MDNVKESNILTTAKVEEIMEKEKYSRKLKRSEYIWFNGKRGIRKSNLSFAMTKDERSEFFKCQLSVYYFAQKFCKIKREDGSIGEITLRDYQKDMIKLFNENRYSILMASRQMGKCFDYNTMVDVKIDDIYYSIPIGILYYNELEKERKLTIMEKIKINLYKLLSILN